MSAGRRSAVTSVVLGLSIVAVQTGCGRDGRDLRTPPGPVGTVGTVGTVERSISIDLLSSPQNAIAEVVGAGATASDPVTVDGRPAVVESFSTNSDGTFRLLVRIDEEGAHTVCVADVCGRVFTLAADAETPEEVVARIEEAISIAATIVPFEEWFPDWTVEIGGAMSGTGGTADAARRVVTVHRNRGRSVDEFVRTVLHEFGHVADIERLDDDDRAAYTAFAGYPVDTPWTARSALSIEDWAAQPSEDFAEVLVAGWTDGRWAPRTRDELTDELVRYALELVGSDGMDADG